MMKPFHHEELAVNSVMGLIQQGAGHGHTRVFEHCIPARLPLLKPLPHPRAVGRPSRGSDVVDKMAQPLAQRKHSQAFALARPVPQGMELGA